MFFIYTTGIFKFSICLTIQIIHLCCTTNCFAYSLFITCRGVGPLLSIFNQFYEYYPSSIFFCGIFNTSLSVLSRSATSVSTYITGFLLFLIFLSKLTSKVDLSSILKVKIHTWNWNQNWFGNYCWSRWQVCYYEGRNVINRILRLSVITRGRLSQPGSFEEDTALLPRLGLEFGISITVRVMKTELSILAIYYTKTG